MTEFVVTTVDGAEVGTHVAVFLRDGEVSISGFLMPAEARLFAQAILDAADVVFAAHNDGSAVTYCPHARPVGIPCPHCLGINDATPAHIDGSGAPDA